jgi:DNA-binding NarL/FixJ family response regulator
MWYLRADFGIRLASGFICACNTGKTVHPPNRVGAMVCAFLTMRKRILIADDETSVRRAIRTFIESRSQLEVCEAVDGAEALHKARALNPDLIVLDLAMPNANGVEVALVLSRSMPHTPVVLFTMFDEAFGRSPVRTLGISAIVAKSDGVANLLGRIEALLNAPDGLAKQER